MKATTLLKQQHRKVEELFANIEDEEKSPAALLTQLATMLAAHMTIEQNIFYPSVRDVDADLVSESYEEHAIAELALKRLIATAPDDPTFKAKLATAKELVIHHVGEEEEGLFPEVEARIDADQLDSIGHQLEQAFVLAQQEGFEALVPATFARTSADEALRTLGAQRAAEATSVEHNGRASSAPR